MAWQRVRVNPDGGGGIQFKYSAPMGFLQLVSVVEGDVILSDNIPQTLVYKGNEGGGKSGLFNLVNVLLVDDEIFVIRNEDNYFVWRRKKKGKIEIS